jgi:hypothetical protein
MTRRERWSGGQATAGRTKIHEPHVQLALLVTRLKLLAQATDLVRRAARFVLVARRLEGQMERVRNAVDGSEKKHEQGELDVRLVYLDLQPFKRGRQ